jgi:hypothetical protein
MNFLKSVVLILMVSLFSIANGIESIAFLYKQFNPVLVLGVCDFDCDCEESNKESEKTNEKTEKLSYFEDLNSLSDLLSANFSGRKLHQNNRLNFSSSDYSQVVYSPPELS